jgi:hypothetical protein
LLGGNVQVKMFQKIDAFVIGQQTAPLEAVKDCRHEQQSRAT